MPPAISAWASIASPRSTCPPYACSPPCRALRLKRWRSQISQRIEEAVNTVEGINELRSISGQGSSIIIVTFNLERDIDTAAQDVRDRVATTLRDLPDGTDPPLISKFRQRPGTGLDPGAVVGTARSRELTELADKVVKAQLERSAGVGEVDHCRWPGTRHQCLDRCRPPGRLSGSRSPRCATPSCARTPTCPAATSPRARANRPCAPWAASTDPRAFNDLVIATVNGAPIRVRDIGRAEDGTKEQRSVARLNGVPTVILEVRRQSGANTVEVIKAVKANLAARHRRSSRPT